jgi:hypothetical protein
MGTDDPVVQCLALAAARGKALRIARDAAQRESEGKSSEPAVWQGTLTGTTVPVEQRPDGHQTTVKGGKE